ncbi:acyl carrier protein [Micromonospora sp. DT229]|uniref:acyl carrier protein n=1 Tax=Micromonospora sp. DT229 TaxID=3393430 RepID=UPI003CECA0B8
MQAIEERVSKVLLDIFKVSPQALRHDTTLSELNFDSLVIVELVLILSNEFGVPLEDSDLHDRMTVADIAKVLDAKDAVS